MVSLPLCLIVAATRNQVIGRDNAMPWHLPEDLRYFKEKTLGKPVIMGRKSWESLGRPLPGRLNIVVSRRPSLRLDGAEVYASLDKAITRARQWAKEQAVDEIMLIGGGQLYHQALSQANRIYLTRIEIELEGDTWFPELPFDEWQRVDAQSQPATGDQPAYTFVVWEKRE